MYVILSLIVIDWLLPDVHVPAFAWALLLLLWVCKKAVHEAKKVPVVKEAEKVSADPEIDWIASATLEGTYATVDGDWAIIHSEDDCYILEGATDQFVILTATTLASAMDQADFIIRTLTPLE